MSFRSTREAMIPAHDELINQLVFFFTQATILIMSQAKNAKHSPAYDD